MAATVSAWRVRAANLPEHAGNPIHTDAGARAAGFDAALVAGVTVYAYLTHPVVDAWGVDWVRSGAAEVRFLAPVLDGDAVECVPVDDEDGTTIDAIVEGDKRARCRVWPPTRTPDRPALRAAGASLERAAFRLNGRWDGYGRRAGDDLDLYDERGIVHPAVWPALANDIVGRQLVDGSWIHTRSRIWHLDTVPVGSTVTVDASVIDRLTTRAGERAVLDIDVRLDGELVARLEHEALVRLTPGA